VAGSLFPSCVWIGNQNQDNGIDTPGVKDQNSGITSPNRGASQVTPGIMLLSMVRPSTVFKYEPFTLQSVENLKACTIYFGSPYDFNDPFDCAIDSPLSPLTDEEILAIRDSFLQDPLASDVQKQSLQELSIEVMREEVYRGAIIAIEKEKEHFLQNRGVTCFSETNENLLMWSHYGDRYHGFCLEFRTDFEPFGKLRKVEYVSKPPTLNTRDIGLNIEHSHVIDKLYCTKSIDWSYEQEWRVIHANARQPFTYKPEALKSIYFGPRMSEQRIDMLCLILFSQAPHVQLFRGSRSATEFKVEFSEITGYIPYAEAKKRGLT
jgi:hypothetical protein